MAFNPDVDIPSLSGKVILLSKHNPAQIFLASRSENNAQIPIDEIRAAVPQAAPITFLELDLSSFSRIKRAAAECRSKSTKLDILINNAGIMATPAGTTSDGYEIQFGTNHMGHALLTKLLLPALEETAKTSKDVRIVSLSSNAEAWAPKEHWDFDQLKTDIASTSAFTRYGISKIANIYHSQALSRGYPDIRCVAVHPGIMNTGLGGGLFASFPLFAPLIRIPSAFVSKSPSKGAQNQLWASVSPDAKSGEYYNPVGVPGKGLPQSLVGEFEDALWDWTEKELEGYLGCQED